MYGKREQFRLIALKRCEDTLANAKAIQMCYDGKIIRKMDRYVFLGQFSENGEKMEKVIAIKTFKEGHRWHLKPYLQKQQNNVYMF